MAHLVEYEEARTEKEKALCAIECSRAKSAKSGAWSWADRAVEHAVAAGIKDAGYLVVKGRYPGLDELEERLKAL